MQDSRERPFQFHIRDVLWATAIVGVLAALAVQHGLEIALAVTAITLFATFLVTRSRAPGIALLLVVFAAMVLALAPEAPDTARRRPQCVNHLKLIGLALYNYADRYGCFPPAYITDVNGKPIHSWPP